MGEIVAAIGTCHTPYMFTRPPDEDPNQLEQAGRAHERARQGARRDQAGRDPVLRRRSRRDLLRQLRAVVRHRRRRPRDGEVRRTRAQPPDSPRARRGHPQQAGRRSQLRHGVFRGCGAGARLLDSVRVRDRQAQHSRSSRSSPTSTCRRCRRRAAARRWARRSRRSSRDARSGWRSSPAAACRTSPAPPNT